LKEETMQTISTLGLTLGPSIKYDTGSSNSVALDDEGNVVEVHVGTGTNSLFYHVGKVDFGARTVDWGASNQYDTGSSNSVAVDNEGNVVEVHVGTGTNLLYYRVGKVDFATRTIDFGPSTQYDTGDRNSVALRNDGTVVEVHVGTGTNLLYYRVGKVNFAKQTIDFGLSTQYDTGSSNAVALRNDGTAVEVHVGVGTGTNNLYYHVGTVDPATQTIDFGRSTQYDTGGPNAIAADARGNVVEVHVGSGTLYYHVGKIASIPTICWTTPWAPVNDAQFQAALATPESYQAYLVELANMGIAFQQLSENGWTTTTNTDTLVVMEQNNQVGTFTVRAWPTTDPLPEEARRRGIVQDTENYDYYILELGFYGAASHVAHTTATWLAVAGTTVGVLNLIAVGMSRYGKYLFSKIAQSISAADDNAVADAAGESGEVAATDAAEAASASFTFADVAFVAGAAGMVLGLTGLIIRLLEQDFELKITVANRSLRHYLIIPNYYMDHATITAAANSCAYLTGPTNLVGPQALPPTICKDANTWLYSPPVQIHNSQVGPQASEFTLVYQNDGLNAPSVLLQLVDCTYTRPEQGQLHGTLTPPAWDTGWTGVVVNTHYHTDDPPNIAMFTAGADLKQAEDWYDQYDDVTPASTGTFSAENATLGWVLSAGSPGPDPSAGNATCWYLAITIDDA
jgi:hypothetical protein